MDLVNKCKNGYISKILIFSPIISDRKTCRKSNVFDKEDIQKLYHIQDTDTTNYINAAPAKPQQSKYHSQTANSYCRNKAEKCGDGGVGSSSVPNLENQVNTANVDTVRSALLQVLSTPDDFLSNTLGFQNATFNAHIRCLSQVKGSVAQCGKARDIAAIVKFFLKIFGDKTFEKNECQKLPGGTAAIEQFVIALNNHSNTNIAAKNLPQVGNGHESNGPTQSEVISSTEEVPADPPTCPPPSAANGPLSASSGGVPAATEAVQTPPASSGVVCSQRTHEAVATEQDDASVTPTLKLRGECCDETSQIKAVSGRSSKEPACQGGAPAGSLSASSDGVPATTEAVQSPPASPGDVTGKRTHGATATEQDEVSVIRTLKLHGECSDETSQIKAVSGHFSKEPACQEGASPVSSGETRREACDTVQQNLFHEALVDAGSQEEDFSDQACLQSHPVTSCSENQKGTSDCEKQNPSKKVTETIPVSVPGDSREKQACHETQRMASCTGHQREASEYEEPRPTEIVSDTISKEPIYDMGDLVEEDAANPTATRPFASERQLETYHQKEANSSAFPSVVADSLEGLEGNETRPAAPRSENQKRGSDGEKVSSEVLLDTASPIGSAVVGDSCEQRQCHKSQPVALSSEKQREMSDYEGQNSSATSPKACLENQSPDSCAADQKQISDNKEKRSLETSNKTKQSGPPAVSAAGYTDKVRRHTRNTSQSKGTFMDNLGATNGDVTGAADSVFSKLVFRVESEVSDNTEEQVVTLSFPGEDFAPRENKSRRGLDHMDVFCGLRKVHSVLSSKCDDHFDHELPKQAALDYVQNAARDIIVFPFNLDYLFFETCYELWRLSTFSPLDDLLVSPIRLAKSGFFYDQGRDIILCFSCAVIKRTWNESEKKVALVHLQISPDCDQANFRDTRNIPINGQQIQAPGTGKEGQQPPDHTVQVYVQSSSQNQSAAQCETDSDSVTSEGSPVQVGQTSASRQVTALSTTDSRSEGGRNSSVEARNLSLPTPPQDLELIAKHREYAAQSAGTAAPSSSVSPNLSKSGVVLGTYNAASLVSNNSVTFTTSQVPTRTASGEGPEYIRFSVQVTQSSGSQASVPQTSSSGGNGGQDACDSVSTVQFDDAVLTSLDMNRAASPLNAKTRSRFLSFAGWPRNSGLSPTVLAEAGFYYLGSGDSVRCWYCGIILRNWRQSDDPWVTHVLFRFSCDFVLAVRGQNFITQALIRRGHASNTQRENGSARFAGPTNGQSGSQAPRSANGTPEEQVRYGISGESPTTHLSATTSQRQPSCQDTANGTSNNTFNVDDASNKVSGVNTQDNRRTSAASPAAPNTTRSSEPDSANGRPGVQSTVVTNGRGRLDGAENERSSRDSRERRSTPDPSSVAGRGNAVSRGPGLSTDAAMSSTSNSRPAAGSSSSRPSSAAGASNTGRSASSSRNSSASEPSSGASPSTKSGSASGRNNVGEKRKSKSNKGSKKGTGNGDTSASKKTGAANVTPGQHAPQQELQTDAVPIAGDAAHARRAQASVAAVDAVRPGVTGMAARQEVRELNTTSHRQQSSITPEQNGCTPLTGAITRNQSMSAEDAEQYYQRLMQDNRRLRERRTCKICRRNVIDTIFLPCGHLCTCDTCSATIRECCLCYQRIRGTAHVYME